MSKLYKHNFKAFVLSNGVLFYSVAKRYLANQNIIEDILQDCYIKLWTNIDNMGHVSDAKLYMFAMIKNAALNYNKREKKIELSDNLEDRLDLEDHLHPSSNFIDEIFEEEATLLLAKALAILPKKQRKVMLLSLKGYKNSEIASLMGTTEDSVKSRKKRAVQKLIDFISPK